MKIFETRKFKKLREKLKNKQEKEALKSAVENIITDPTAGKRLKGELKGLSRYRYSIQGQERRLIYKVEDNTLYLLSFGPREGIYK